MMGRQAGQQEQLFYSFSLDDHVPSDHLLRTIDRGLNLSELRRHFDFWPLAALCCVDSA
jgi:hypothetical protein